jgi:hypothetical protein
MRMTEGEEHENKSLACFAGISGRHRLRRASFRDSNTAATLHHCHAYVIPGFAAPHAQHA